MEGAPNTVWFNRHSATSFGRIIPRLRHRFSAVPEPEWQAFAARLESHFERLFSLLYGLYGRHYDFFYHLENILSTAVERWVARPDDLKALDAARETDPSWYQSHRMQGYILYVDLFAGNLDHVHARIPYLKEMGVTYLHLMPLFRCPAGDNDGGYAISSYREVNPKIGTMEQLADLARDLRNHGISLCLDFVFNHTADEHEWARAALDGSVDHQEYYRMYDDRAVPDEFERTVRSVFPDEHPGCFTYRSRIRKWVWTTFKNYQWDLNYENPVVFNRMADEMLFLANQGVEVLRLDAVAFLWKAAGTSCENLPEAHQLIQAFNALVRIAAPAMVFKSEAIVHPDEVARYIGEEECQLSYNPNLMALLWNALATREVSLLEASLRQRFALPPNAAWVNYVRCHDDIGWAFSDEDALALGMNPADHRRFLNDFYTGRHPASFAVGLPFQENPVTGDARVSGTCASLAGLERAIEAGDPGAIDLAVRRVLLLHGIIFTIGGIPLVYSGDELGALNDYRFRDDAEKEGDSRWVHRSVFDWDRAERRGDQTTPEGRIFAGLLKLSQLRQNNLAFTRSETEIIETGNRHVLGYFRQHLEQSVLVLANFSEQPQTLPATRLRQLGFRRTLTDLLAGRLVTAGETLALEACQLMILIGGRPH
ncbi:MAG: cyclomaltodextrinase C-terminal domain-containing protein [Verrucomicrobiales bacterium]|nr:cyclomaltodextrinase C-terminal domain-containing protein [Verrucomicrobiales bacterium]